MKKDTDWRLAIKEVSERCLPLRASDEAFGNDVYCVSDVTPYGAMGKHRITLRVSAIHHRHKHNIIMSVANNIAPLPLESKTRYNTLQLCRKDNV